MKNKSLIIFPSHAPVARWGSKVSGSAPLPLFKIFSSFAYKIEGVGLIIIKINKNKNIFKKTLNKGSLHFYKT